MILRTNQRKKATNNVAFFEIIKKYLWVIPAVFLLVWLIPTLKRLMDKMDLKEKENQSNLGVEQNNFENQTGDPNVIKAKTAQIKSKYPLISDARLSELKTSAGVIADALGTSPMYNYKNNWVDLFLTGGWIEDETAVIRECKKYPGSWGALQDFYYSLSTQSRNLNADIYKYLSKANIEEIKKQHKKYGNYSNL